MIRSNFFLTFINRCKSLIISIVLMFTSCTNSVIQNDSNNEKVIRALSYKVSLELCICDTSYIGKYPNSMVSVIMFEGSKMKVFPSVLQSCYNCNWVDIYNPQFKDFPEELCNYKSLEAIILKKNSFKKVPECVFSLTNIRVLQLEGSLLQNIPNGISNLINLEVLSLSISENPIIPKGFFKLKKLCLFEVYRLKNNKNYKVSKNDLSEIKKLFKDSLPRCQVVINGVGL